VIAKALDRAAAMLPPLATTVLLIAGWQVLVRTGGLPSYLLPSPAMVVARLQEGIIGGDMIGHIGSTLAAAALGYAVAMVAALVLAAVCAESVVVDQTLYPMIVGFQSIPKVALAPLILIWAGYGEVSEVILTAMIAFLPIFSSTLIGLRSVDRQLVDLFRVYHGGRLFRLWHLSFPGAAGHIFAGLQVAVGFALVGCVVVEFLVQTAGVGFLIQNAANTLDSATAVAAMVALGVVGALGGMLVRSIRRRVIFWDQGGATR
jgi:NitT/TauT family transport system permease protein